MAHFAELNEKNIVVRVLVVPDEQEHRGEEFLRDDLQLGGRWIQTSYNNKIRKRFAGINHYYDEQGDVFISPAPFQSWILNSNYDWEAPIPKPTDKECYWDESSLSWIPYLDGITMPPSFYNGCC